MYFWNWTTNPNQGGLNNEDYTPHGKPAEDILEEWYAKSKETAVRNRSWTYYE